MTGLDIIGIPVWFAARPNSRGLSVSQGKGLVAEQARLSAIMEAIEGAVAEETRKHIAAFSSVQEMRDKELLSFLSKPSAGSIATRSIREKNAPG